MKHLEITWYGHSNVFLQADGVSVLIDPFFEGNRFAPDWHDAPRPDIVMVTHSHGDHLGQAMDIARKHGSTIYCISDLADWIIAQGFPGGQIVNHGIGWCMDGTVGEKGMKATMVPAVHSANPGSPAGFVLEFEDGPTVYHAGDTALFGDMRLIGERFKLDLSMLPVGGIYTMDGDRAARACALLGTAAAMPMHYATFPMLDQTPDLFLASLGTHAPDCRAIVPAPGETFTL